MDYPYFENYKSCENIINYSKPRVMDSKVVCVDGNDYVVMGMCRW